MFLGFTHFCGRIAHAGVFTVWRITAKKRMVEKLKALKLEPQRRKHGAAAQPKAAKKANKTAAKKAAVKAPTAIKKAASKKTALAPVPAATEV